MIVYCRDLTHIDRPILTVECSSRTAVEDGATQLGGARLPAFTVLSSCMERTESIASLARMLAGKSVSLLLSDDWDVFER